MKRIVVAGAGLIGRRHVAVVRESSRAVLAGIVDPRPETALFAEQHGVAWHRDLAECLAREHVDGVILATPNANHLEGAQCAAEAGVAMLIEKPVVDSLQALEQLQQTLATYPVPTLVGHHRRHSATLGAARQVLRSGQLGRLVSVVGSAQFHKPTQYFLEAPWRTFQGGGPLLINLVHEIDSLRFLVGEIVGVQAFTSNSIRGFEVEDSAAILLRFANGALGTFMLSDTAAAPWSWEQTSGENEAYPRAEQDTYLVAGTQGSLAIPSMQTWSYPGEASWWLPFDQTRHHVDRSDPLEVQFDHFCDVVSAISESLCSVNDAGNNLRVIAAIQRAASTGTTVDVSSIT